MNTEVEIVRKGREKAIRLRFYVAFNLLATVYLMIFSCDVDSHAKAPALLAVAFASLLASNIRSIARLEAALLMAEILKEAEK